MAALSRIAEIRSRFGLDQPAAAPAPSPTTAASFARVLSQEQAQVWSATTPPASTRPTAASTTTASVSGPVLTDATPYASLFREAGARHGVDPNLLAAVAKVESGFNPTARSSAGALGLMQFMPSTAQGMGVDPLDPASAVDGAARLLRSHVERFGSLELALAAYNAGPGNVQRYGGVPPFAETQAYVSKVLALVPGGAS